MSLMEYSFTYIERPDYLHIKVTGTNTAPTIQRYLREIHEICVKMNCSRILIEENLAGPSMDIVDIFWQVVKGSEMVGPIRCIAFVDVNPDHDSSRMKFAETVAVNRGINMRVFATVAEAEKWLVELKTAQV